MARNRNWSFLESVINGAFTVPGDGAVDFRALIGILRTQRLPRLAGRRGGAGPRRRARVSLCRHGLSASVAARAQRQRARVSDPARRVGTRHLEGIRMNLLVKARREGRDIVEVTPQSAGWRYVGFSAHRLAPGESMRIERTGGEALHRRARRHASPSRRATARPGATSASGATCSTIGAPYAVYLPDGRDIARAARTRRRRSASRSAPGRGTAAARADRAGADEALRARQAARTSAFVCDILPQTEPAEHLLVVEVRTPSGHSSSYPPHKHDTDNLPQESSLEETYYHRLQPGAGLRVPARLHRRPLARRIAGGRGSRRRDGAARLPSGRRALRLRIVLSERDGGAAARMAFPERPGARVDAEGVRYAIMNDRGRP